MRTKRTDWGVQYRRYEEEKRKLIGLSPKEYEQAVKKLAEKYGV